MHNLILSKSLLKRSLQCQKQLYLHAYQPKLGAPASAADQIKILNGNRAGEAARKLYPGGVLIDGPYDDFAGLIANTNNAVSMGALTIFEGAFLFDNNVFVRADILTREFVGAPWKLLEVKATTGIEDGDLNLEDLTIQAWVLRNCGIQLASASLMYINSNAVFKSMSELFVTVDFTAAVWARITDIPSLVNSAKNTMTQSMPPLVKVGLQCHTPSDCRFMSHCRGECNIPQPSLFNLPGIRKKKAYEYFNKGIVELDDPGITDLSERQTAMLERMRQAKHSGTSWVDREAARHEIHSWTWPCYFLDFETINPVLPWIAGTKPFQQIPFQFSCHIQTAPGGLIAAHREFLHEDTTDPRPAFLAALLDFIGDQGSVVVYHQAAERTRLRELAEAFPHLAQRIHSIIDRIVDLEKLIQAHVYHHKFFGSFSMKYVGPAILGQEADYKGLPIGNGLEAQLGFEELIAPEIPLARKAELRRDMLHYCKQDTLLMVLLVNWLVNGEKEGG